MSKDIQSLTPGKPITLDSGITITVYPLGLRQLNRFSSAISAAMSSIMKSLPSSSVGVKDTDVGELVLGQLSTLLLTDLIALLKDCLVIEEGYDLETLPHYEIPAVLDMWIEESFGEEKKWKPWITMIENQVKKFTGKEIQILDMLSRSYSSPDTPDKTS